MPTFLYIARTTSGQRVTGQLVAMNVDAALADLEKKELAAVSVEPEQVSGWQTLLGRQTSTNEKSPHISTRGLATFYRQLSDLLRSGVPILRALKLLSRSKSNAKLAEIVGQIANDVADGEGLADSMMKRDQTFPAVHIAMVRAGERGGFLEEVLQRLAFFLTKQADLRSNLIGTLIYPLILLVLGTIIIGVVMVVFVPKFKTMLEGLDIPLPTRVVMFISDMLAEHLWGVVFAILGAAVLCMWLRVQPDVRSFVSRTSIRIWVVGSLLRSISVARFCRILGTMLGNGIPVLQAMQISKDAAGNQVMVNAIEAASKSVQSGESLAEPLERSGLFEEDVIEVIRIGESANNLDEVLVSLAETLESRIDRVLTTSVRLLEPALLLGLGLAMLFIIMALVVPLVMLTDTV